MNYAESTYVNQVWIVSGGDDTGYLTSGTHIFTISTSVTVSFYGNYVLSVVSTKRTLPSEINGARR